MSPDDPRHGSTAGYNAHRKDGDDPCVECRRAAAKYEAQRAIDSLIGRPRTVSALGAKRRVQALMAIGWSAEQQAEELGWTHKKSVHRLRFCKYVQRATHDQVAAMYERLSGRAGPSAVTRTRARQAGYAPPLARDDIDNDRAPKGVRAA